MSKDVGANAVAPVSFAAAGLARELFNDHLVNIHAPKKHRVIPEITVTVGYRFEKIED